MEILNSERSIKLDIENKKLEIRVYEGKREKPVLLLLHGATNDMNHPLIKGLAEVMAKKGWTTVRFNFGFVKEQKRPEFSEVTKEYITVLKWIQNKFRGSPVYVAGKSLGAFVAIFNGKNTRVDGIIAFGYPVKRPDGSLIDQTHLKDFSIPILFIQGTADPYADKDFLERTINDYGLNALSFWLENVGHSLKGQEAVGIEIAVSNLEGWVQKKKRKDDDETI